MSMEEDPHLNPAEIKKAAEVEYPLALENVSEFPQKEREETEREKLIGRIGLAAIDLNLKGAPLKPDGSIDIDAIEAAQNKAPLAASAGGVPPQEPPSYAESDAEKLDRRIAENNLAADANELAEKAQNAAAANSAETTPPAPQTNSAVETAPNGPVKDPTAGGLEYSFVGRAGTKIGLKVESILNAPRKIALEKLNGFWSSRAARAEAKKSAQEAKLKKMEENLAVGDAKAEMLRNSGEKIFTPNVAAKITKERDDYKKKLEKEQNKLGALDRKLRTSANRQATSANRVKRVAEKIMAEIDAKSLPSKTKFEELTRREDAVAEHLETLKHARDTGHEEMVKLEQQYNSDPGSLEGFGVKTKLEQARELLKKIDSHYNTYAKELVRISKRKINVNDNMDILKVARDKEARRATMDQRFPEAAQHAPVETGERREHVFSHESPPIPLESKERNAAPNTGPSVQEAPVKTAEAEPVVEEAAQEIGPSVHTPEDLEEMHKQLVTNIPLRKAFYATFKNHLYPKSRFIDGYVPTTEDIEKFIEAVPTVQAFDTTFITGKVGRLQSDIQSATSPLVKGNLEEALKLQNKEEKDTYPKLKEFLYGIK